MIVKNQTLDPCPYPTSAAAEVARAAATLTHCAKSFSVG